MKLNDEVISHIAKCLQLGLLTGTDVIDHLRMISLKEQDGELFLDPEYAERHEKNIQDMLNNASQLGFDNMTMCKLDNMFEKRLSFIKMILSKWIMPCNRQGYVGVKYFEYMDVITGTKSV